MFVRYLQVVLAIEARKPSQPIRRRVGGPCHSVCSFPRQLVAGLTSFVSLSRNCTRPYPRRSDSASDSPCGLWRGVLEGRKARVGRLDHSLVGYAAHLQKTYSCCMHEAAGPSRGLFVIRSVPLEAGDSTGGGWITSGPAPVADRTIGASQGLAGRAASSHSPYRLRLR